MCAFASSLMHCTSSENGLSPGIQDIEREAIYKTLLDDLYDCLCFMHSKKSFIFRCYFSEELIALTVLRWIRVRYLRITKPEL